MERWSSGLRHTLGKRARLTASAGSNPVLSAKFLGHFDCFAVKMPFFVGFWRKIRWSLAVFVAKGRNLSQEGTAEAHKRDKLSCKLLVERLFDRFCVFSAHLLRVFQCFNQFYV